MTQTLKNQLLSFLGGMFLASCCALLVGFAMTDQMESRNIRQHKQDSLEIAKRDSVNQENIKVNDNLKIEYSKIIHPMKKPH